MNAEPSPRTVTFRPWRDSMVVQIGVLAISVLCLPLYLVGVSWVALWPFVGMPYFVVTLLHRRREMGSWSPSPYYAMPKRGGR